MWEKLPISFTAARLAANWLLFLKEKSNKWKSYCIQLSAALLEEEAKLQSEDTQYSFAYVSFEKSNKNTQKMIM